jgi:hypothetical protein
MLLESLTELMERMEKEGILFFNPKAKGRKNIMMVEPPARIIDINRKEVMFYALIRVGRVGKFNKKGGEVKFDEQLYYTILDEDTVMDMKRQVLEGVDKRKQTLEEIYKCVKDENDFGHMYV